MNAKTCLNVALVGNPNAGKTSIFNALTGAKQHVGNYPGVTVDLAEAMLRYHEWLLHCIDLPGTYSLASYSQEERVTGDFLMEREVDVIVNVIDGSNLERNFYLTVQLMELNKPMVLAVNMLDIAEQRGAKIDLPGLAALLGIPVVAVNGSRVSGMKELKAAVVEAWTKPRKHAFDLPYSHELLPALNLVEEELAIHMSDLGLPPRFLALGLLEDETLWGMKCSHHREWEHVKTAIASAKKMIRNHSGEDSATAVIEARYAVADGITRSVCRYAKNQNVMLSDKIDRVVCHRIGGPVVLCLVVYLLFTLVFKLAEEWRYIPIGGGVWESPDGAVRYLFSLFDEFARTHIAAGALQSMVCDGIIAGVGGVIGFVPLIFFMFLFISMLEDSGYIARAAFIMDRLLRTFGLQGKSILALIISGGLGAGGCAVPGVLATRALREEKDRLLTILVVPFMNCGAKMPVYAMLIAAFFSACQGMVMFILWVMSWCFALGSAWVLRRFLVRGEQTPFVMELPIYHLPTVRGLLTDTWHRTKMFIKKAATVILAVNVIMWALMYYPHTEGENAGEQLRSSYAGQIGEFLTPVTELAGFDWRENIALIGGVAAKEVILGTLATAYTMGENAVLAEGDAPQDEGEELAEILATNPQWNRIRAIAMLIFIVGYAPCVATLAAIRKETGSWKWMFFSAGYTTILAFIVAVIVYQIGIRIG